MVQCINLLGERLEGFTRYSEEGVESNDDKTPFLVCQILTLFDERLAQIEKCLGITE